VGKHQNTSDDSATATCYHSEGPELKNSFVTARQPQQGECSDRCCTWTACHPFSVLPLHTCPLFASGQKTDCSLLYKYCSPHARCGQSLPLEMVSLYGSECLKSPGPFILSTFGLALRLTNWCASFHAKGRCHRWLVGVRPKARSAFLGTFIPCEPFRHPQPLALGFTYPQALVQHPIDGWMEGRQ